MDRDTDVKSIVAMMLESERWHRQDLRNRFSGYAEPVLELMIHEAMERVREEHGVHFGVLRGHPGTYERKGAEATAGNAHRQRRRGIRALERAASKLSLAASKSTDDAERQRHERAADRLRERVAWNGQRQPVRPPSGGDAR